MKLWNRRTGPAPTAQPDLLQRHLLCHATGLHDRDPDGICRDCREPLAPDARCAPELPADARALPDQEQP